MIRALAEKDVDEFLKIRMDSLKLSPKSFGADPNTNIDKERTRLDLQSKNEENFILGYLEGDQVTGMIGFIREKSIKKRHKGFIWGVFVYAEYRGRGIGKKLMESCLHRLSTIHGLEKVVLTVSSTSTEAIALYEKFGFSQFGIEKKSMKWQDEYVDEIYMEKLLKNGADT